MRISSQEELDILREGGKRLRAIIETVGKAAQPGVAVKTLDTLACSSLEQRETLRLF